MHKKKKDSQSFSPVFSLLWKSTARLILSRDTRVEQNHFFFYKKWNILLNSITVGFILLEIVSNLLPKYGFALLLCYLLLYTNAATILGKLNLFYSSPSGNIASHILNIVPNNDAIFRWFTSPPPNECYKRSVQLDRDSKEMKKSTLIQTYKNVLGDFPAFNQWAPQYLKYFIPFIYSLYNNNRRWAKCERMGGM